MSFPHSQEVKDKTIALAHIYSQHPLHGIKEVIDMLIEIDEFLSTMWDNGCGTPILQHMDFVKEVKILCS